MNTFKKKIQILLAVTLEVLYGQESGDSHLLKLNYCHYDGNMRKLQSLLQYLYLTNNYVLLK